MKTFLVSALALLGAIGLSVTADVCDLTKIHAALVANSNTSSALSTSEPKCLDATGYDIFANVTSFPTLTQSKKAQKASSCSTLINLVNGNANVQSQCTIEVNGTSVVYGHLISSFINGKTGNESDSGSASVGDSESTSGSESESGSSNSSAHSSSHSGASTTTLSFVTYGAIAAIAVALR
ncbi:hypothetical protein PHMEG_00028470 [Phytophthora megakarya]|uniref:Elicitin n=1 Tax=Phytophthora megakarya TaxID=4795 RepID=A0A225V6F5_9STRA|nr:hypothetical protein PHMEG_00028470 [Phytophthora megakarya]